MSETIMGYNHRSANMRRPNEAMRLVVTTFVSIVFGFFIGTSFPEISLTKDKYSGISTQALMNIWASIKNRGPFASEPYDSKIWVSMNPRGAERLPAGIVTSESDLYTRKASGWPSEDIIVKPRYLVTFTVGYDQKDHIDRSVKKFSEQFTILLFHYDGRISEWDQFEWSKRAIHLSAPKQTKWWYAKRFLHPDIVAPYDYIFIWDEDLGLDNFDPVEYIRLANKHGLDISQPGLSPDSVTTWQMTKKQNHSEVHKSTEERPGWCEDPHLPPCAAFIEIMAPVFSRKAWRCVWHLIQNDLVHGWGLDFALRKCVDPAHEKIGVVDSQWIVHTSIPSLDSQGQEENGKTPREGVRERCQDEWAMFQSRFISAEKSYYKSKGIDISNYTSSIGGGHIHSNKTDEESSHRH